MKNAPGRIFFTFILLEIKIRLKSYPLKARTKMAITSKLVVLMKSMR